MIRYVAERLGWAILTLWVVVTLVFFISRAAGDPTALLLPYDATPQIKHQIEHQFGLDRPIWVQYLLFFENSARGDFGVSYRNSLSVAAMIEDTAPRSFLLTGVAMVLSILIGVPVGVMAAVRRNSWIDFLARGFAFLGQALPPFFVAMMLIGGIAANVSWLPVGGDDTWSAPILPALNLTCFIGAAIVRLLRASMIEALQSPYVRMARMKGLPERTVIWKHALKNALIPVLSLTGMYAALSLTIAVVVEVVFAWPGLGLMTYEAILNRDLPVLQAVVILASTVTIGMSFFVDWISALIDPRLRSGTQA